jgi:aryl-alcohol dehydrogenase-like predicted oxidoreductase
MSSSSRRSAARGGCCSRSLQRLKTDRIDIIQLHSPSLDDVAFGDGLEGLKKAQQAGKVRFISLSADGDAARKAIEIGDYDTLQLTYNLLEQEPGHDVIPAARAKAMGIIVKNPIANAVYEKPRPAGNAAQLWDRAQTLLAPEWVADGSRVGTALRWLLADGNVHTAIVGTTNLRHLEENVAAAERGSLPETALAEIRRRWEALSSAG